jgi:hypothetical protein
VQKGNAPKGEGLVKIDASAARLILEQPNKKTARQMLAPWAFCVLLSH